MASLNSSTKKDVSYFAVNRSSFLQCHHWDYVQLLLLHRKLISGMAVVQCAEKVWHKRTTETHALVVSIVLFEVPNKRT